MSAIMFETKYDYKYKNAIPDSYYGTPADNEYLRLNPDIAAAVADNIAIPSSVGAFTSGYAHYVIWGKAEGRIYPSFDFNEEQLAKVTADELTAAKLRLSQTLADVNTTGAEREAAFLAETNAKIAADKAAAVKSSLTTGGLQSSVSTLTESGMTTVYIVGAIAVIGILALLFKKKKS